MNGFIIVLVATMKSLLRDRILHSLLGVALLLFVLVPVFSLFSMRQVQELAITLSFSGLSIVLLILTVMLGGFSVWRDIERRYAASVLGLPIPRANYLLGKFAAVALFLIFSAVVLALVSVSAILFCGNLSPSELPIRWENLFAALIFETLKYILLAAIALLLSCLSTSFFLPVFGTLAIYFVGNASQEVMEYVTSEFGQKLSAPIQGIAQVLYYLLPNFSAFNLKVEAVYGLQLSMTGLMVTFLYFLVYTGILLTLASWVFSRREIP